VEDIASVVTRIQFQVAVDGDRKARLRTIGSRRERKGGDWKHGSALKQDAVSAEICGNVENDKPGEQAEDNFL